MTDTLVIQIRCRSGSLAGQTYSFLEPGPLPLPRPLRIGRHQDSQVCFGGEGELMVSRQHLELALQGNELLVRDLGSTYGTPKLGSQERITEHALTPGNILDVQLGAGGPACTISFGRALPFSRYL